MKRLLLIILLISPLSCYDGLSNMLDDLTGHNETYSEEEVSFIIAQVPGGFTFPTGTDDNETATVANTYWIAETETTYELWNKVYVWATHSNRGANKYEFANPGLMGSDGAGGTGMTNQHPVTEVNWRDCMVWCNALTEWYNAHKGTNYKCVYTNISSAVIRDSRDSNAAVCDNVVPSTTAKGFRLPTSNEWELAARYRGSDPTNVVTGEVAGVDFDAMGIKWTKGNSASGATADVNNGNATKEVAVYKANSDDKTAPVKTKFPNAAGLYDMSGNVHEWNFDPTGQVRVFRGGSWADYTEDMQVGSWNNDNPDCKGSTLGFRFARSP